MIVEQMSGDLVSIIIPAYNMEAYIGRTLASVTAQTYRNIEIIVVDDGSTDSTADIVETFARHDDRIRLFHSAHRGSAAARNFAAAQAQGAFLAPCDADDIWHAEKIAAQMAIFRQSCERTGVVYCWSAGINENNAVIFPAWARHDAEGNVLHAMIADSLPGNGSVPLIRRSCFERTGGYDPRFELGEDWKFYVALAGICEFKVVRRYLTGYRFRDGSASRDYTANEKYLQMMTEWILNTWPDLPPAVLEERAYTVNCYLSFLAALRRDLLIAFGYRLRAYRYRPAAAFGLPGFKFLLLLAGRFIGLRRYYLTFWRDPPIFEDGFNRHQSGRGIRQDSP